MNFNTFRYTLNAPRKDINGTGAGNFNDEQMIIGDGDESRNMSADQGDEDGMSGPAASHIEANELSDDFLSGRVDLVQQMRKTVDAIHDSLESELREGPAPETSIADNEDSRSVDEEELAEAGIQLSDEDLNLVTSVHSLDEATDLGVTFDGHVVGDYLYSEKENRETPKRTN
jgi:hypothetical protein